MDHYADDLATLTAHLDLHKAIHVGHSTGGGEVVRYIARHGERRVAKAVLIAAVPPLMVKTPATGGLPKQVFDDFQAQVASNRAQFYLDVPSRFTCLRVQDGETRRIGVGQHRRMFSTMFRNDDREPPRAEPSSNFFSSWQSAQEQIAIRLTEFESLSVGKSVGTDFELSRRRHEHGGLGPSGQIVNRAGEGLI